MIKKNNFKIALVGDCLALGGAEKVHARLSVYFENQNIDVHNIIFLDIISYEYSGKLVNLGLLSSKNTSDKLKRLYVLRNYIRNNNFDFIIDFRYRVNAINEILISRFVYNSQTIYTVHSGIIENYIPKNTFLANIIYSKHKIVTVSKAIENKIRETLNINIQTINNPFELNLINDLSLEFVPDEKKYIVAVGRMNERVKQFDKLIEAYSKSELPKNDIKLLIIGDGILIDELINLVSKLNLSDKIIFKYYQNNPKPYFKNALFTVLSSQNEGFPNVLVESLATGTPVVSFDCFSGPAEIIQNENNGLLVENQNIEKLSLAMNRFINDENLYENCKKNAFESINKFSVENIGKQWLNLMQINE